MTLLRASALIAGRGGVPVVRGLDLEVGAGEIVAFLGPNGAGKTTTLLTLSGLLPPLGGTVTLLGADVTGWRANRIARIGMAHVSDDRSLFTSLDVRRNLALGCRDGRADLERALGWFPALRPLLHRRAALLSGGEQQMLALARAMLGRPKILLVDELSMGLAPIVVSAILGVLRKAAQEEGLGILLVEQHVHLVLGVADRAYVLRQGEIVLAGEAATLRSRVGLLESSYLGAAASAQPPRSSHPQSSHPQSNHLEATTSKRTRE